MPIKIILLLAAIHFVGDFLLQTDWMAINKSKNCHALVAHVYVYSMCYIVLMRIIGDGLGAEFILITFTLHLITDAVTSRITSYLWAKEERHWFFVTIGFDQLLHTVQLVLTYKWLVQ